MKILYILFGYIIWITWVHAQWTHDPYINTPIVQTSEPFNEVVMRAASDSKGGAVIVFGRARLLDMTDLDIYAQRIDRHGNKLWCWNGIKV